MQKKIPPPLDSDLNLVKAQLEKIIPDCVRYFADCRNPQKPGFAPISKQSAPYPFQPDSLPSVVNELRHWLFDYPQSASLHPAFSAWSVGGGHSLNMIGKLLEGTAHLTAQTSAQLSVQLENELAGWVKKMLGWPDNSPSLLLSGSSMGNLQALLVARNKFFPAADEIGLSEENKMIVYGSEQTHLTISRALQAIGLGRQAFKSVSINSDGSIDIESLEKLLAADQRTNRSVAQVIVANAGSTLSGAFDQLSAIAVLARKYGAWLHIDAAWGAWLAADPTRAHLLADNQLADSLTLDFHKWPGAAVGTGLVLFKAETDLQKIFSIPNNYLNSISDNIENLGEMGLELTRPARALTPWLILRTCGIKGIGERLGACCDLAAGLASELEKISGCDLRFKVTSNTIVLGFKGPRTPSAEKINAFVKELWAEGISMPSQVLLDHRPYIRFSFLNHSTQQAQIDLLLTKIQQFTGDDDV